MKHNESPLKAVARFGSRHSPSLGARPGSPDGGSAEPSGGESRLVARGGAHAYAWAHRATAWHVRGRARMQVYDLAHRISCDLLPAAHVA